MYIIATMNGIRDVDSRKIKCPICSGKMRPYEFTWPNENADCYWGGHGNFVKPFLKQKGSLVLKCVDCGATLGSLDINNLKEYARIDSVV